MAKITRKCDAKVINRWHHCSLLQTSVNHCTLLIEGHDYKFFCYLITVLLNQKKKKILSAYPHKEHHLLSNPCDTRSKMIL